MDGASCCSLDIASDFHIPGRCALGEDNLSIDSVREIVHSAIEAYCMLDICLADGLMPHKVNRFRYVAVALKETPHQLSVDLEAGLQKRRDLT